MLLVTKLRCWQEQQMMLCDRGGSEGMPETDKERPPPPPQPPKKKKKTEPHIKRKKKRKKEKKKGERERKKKRPPTTHTHKGRKFMWKYTTVSAHLTQAKLTGFVIPIFTTWYCHRVAIKLTYLAHPLLFWHCVYCSSFMGLGPSNKAPETVLTQVCIHCSDTGVHLLLMFCYRCAFTALLQVCIHCSATSVSSLFCYRWAFTLLQVWIHCSATGVHSLFCYMCAVFACFRTTLMYTVFFAHTDSAEKSIETATQITFKEK